MAQLAESRASKGIRAKYPETTSRKQSRRIQSSNMRLYFPIEAKVLRTPFRADVLQTIYDVAKKELGNSLKSAVVSTWISHDEPVPPILLLTIVADANRDEIRRVRKSIFKAISEDASSWTEDQKEDYSKMIYFDIEPLEI